MYKPRKYTTMLRLIFAYHEDHPSRSLGNIGIKLITSIDPLGSKARLFEVF